MLLALTVLSNQKNVWGALLVALTCSCGVLQAQDLCKAALEEAEEAYDKKMYALSVEILNPCLPDAIGPKEHRVRAYELLALSHYELQQTELAENAIRELLKLNGNYVPGPGLDENFKDIVAKVRFVPKEPKKQIPKWTWIVNGAAALASGVVIYYVFKEEPPLPIGDPPVPPQDKR